MPTEFERFVAESEGAPPVPSNHANTEFERFLQESEGVGIDPRQTPALAQFATPKLSTQQPSYGFEPTALPFPSTAPRPANAPTTGFLTPPTPQAAEPFPWGAVAGSTALPLAFGPMGVPASVGLALLGGAGGQATQRLIESRTGGAPLRPRFGEVPDILGQGTIQGVGQLGGEGLAAAAKRFVPRVPMFSASVTPEGRAAAQFMAAKGMPHAVTPAEQTTSSTLDFLENISKGGLFGGSTWEQFRLMRGRKLKEIQQSMLDNIAKETTPTEAGRVLQNALQHHFTDARQLADVQYQFVADNVKGYSIPIKNIKEEFAPAINIALQSGNIEARASGAQLLKQLSKMPDQVPFPVAKELRTSIRTLRETLQNAPETKMARGIQVAKEVEDAFTKQIEHGLRLQNPLVADAWKDGNFLERAAQIQYNPQVIRDLSRKSLPQFEADPELLASGLTKLGPEPIKIWRNAVGPDAWSSFQRVAAESFFPTGSHLGELQGAKWLENMFGGGPGAMDKMKAIFTPQQIINMEDFGKVLQTMQAKQGSTGKVWIQLKQAQAIGAGSSLVYGYATDSPYEGGLGALAILGSPKALAYLMTHPTKSRVFLNTLGLPIHSPVVMSTLTKLVASLPPDVRQPAAEPLAPNSSAPPSPQGSLRPSGLTP